MTLDNETLQMANSLKAILDRSDPETRKTTLSLLEKKIPGANIVELQTDRISKSVEDKFAAFEHKQAAKEANSRLESQRNSLISKGFTEDDVKKIETDVMQKHGISDYEVASKVYAADQPVPVPSYEIRGNRPWKKESLKDFMGNPKDKAREVAAQTALEMRQNPNRRFG